MSRGARAAAAFRRIVDVVLWAFVGLVVGTVLVGQLLPRLDHPVFVVGGPSMEPTIPVGAVVVTGPVSDPDLRPGDVVTMRVGPQQAFFTHRIVRTVERDGAVWLETKGDNNAESDPSIVPASVVIGRVEHTIPILGYLIALLSMPIGVAFAVAVAGSLYALAWLLESFEAEERLPLRDVVRSIAGRRRVLPRSQVHPDVLRGSRARPVGMRTPFGPSPV